MNSAIYLMMLHRHCVKLGEDGFSSCRVLWHSQCIERQHFYLWCILWTIDEVYTLLSDIEQCCGQFYSTSWCYNNRIRNIQVGEAYKCRVSDLINTNFNLCFIDDMCKAISDIELEMWDRSIGLLVWELLLVKGNLKFLTDVHFLVT